jgi:hypothetical protein
MPSFFRFYHTLHVFFLIKKMRLLSKSKLASFFKVNIRVQLQAYLLPTKWGVEANSVLYQCTSYLFSKPIFSHASLQPPGL